MADHQRPALAAVAIALVAVAGCGGGGKKASDAQLAGAAVSGFSKALGSGDGKAGCDLLTSAARATFLKSVQALTATRDCAAAMKKVHDAAGVDVNAAFSAATVSNVKVSGSSATATLTASGHSVRVNLVKQGGKWRLTGVPGT